MKSGKNRIACWIFSACIFACLFMSCEKNISPISSGSTRMEISLSEIGTNKVHTILAQKFFSRCAGQNKRSRASDTIIIDEVKLVVLDLTQWKTWKLFQAAFAATGKETLFENTMLDTTKDYADIVELSFKAYAGNLFNFFGSYSIPLVSATTETTLYLNPGLNYIFYAFRSQGKTIDYGDLSQVINEIEDNVISIGGSQRAIPIDGLVAFYPFDGNTNDSSGNGMNLINSGATLTTGFDGTTNGAYYFSNRATMRYDSTLAIVSQLYNAQGSVSLWVSVPNNFDVYATQGGSVIFNISGDWGTNEGIAISIPTATKVLEAQIHVNNIRYLINSVPATFNAYMHIVMTYDGNSFKLYVNDTLKSSMAVTGNMTYSSTYHTMGVGWWNAVAGYEHYFTGAIDQVRVYNRALTENEVDALYHE